jgi:phage gp36-like protein
MPLLTPTPYATLADVYNSGLPLVAFGPVTVPQAQGMVDEANATIDSYIGAKFTLPLTSWGPDLRRASVVLARFAIISVRGFDPQDEGDKVFKQTYDDTVAWLKLIAKGEVTPVVSDSAAGGKGGAGANNFTTQARTTSSTTQPTLDGQVTVNSDPQGGQVYIGRPSLRGW